MVPPLFFLNHGGGGRDSPPNFHFQSSTIVERSEVLQQRRKERQLFRLVTSKSSLKRLRQITRSSQTLEIIERLEGRSFLKISPFLASHRRHKRVCRMKGHSLASRFGGTSAFQASTSEREATLLRFSQIQTPELMGHPKKTWRRSSKTPVQR